MRRLFSLLFMLGAATLHAHLPEYSPFLSKNEPKRFPVKELVAWRLENPDDNSYLSQANRTRGSMDPIIRVSWRKQDDGVDVTVLSPNMKSNSGPVHVSSATIALYGYSADLNRDGLIDYVRMCPYGNNGVGDVVFVLSEGPHYRFSMISILYAGRDDFLDISGDRGFIFCFQR